MSTTPRLPDTFNRLAWSNLAAQSAEQIALAAAPIVAVLTLGVAEGQTGLQQTGLAFGDAERQHGDNGGCGQRDLLGRLCREVGPGEAIERIGEARRR